MTITVIRLEGKGRYSRADCVSYHPFDTTTEAEDFIRTHTDLASKYWVMAFIASPGKSYETSSDSN